MKDYRSISQRRGLRIVVQSNHVWDIFFIRSCERSIEQAIPVVPEGQMPQS